MHMTSTYVSMHYFILMMMWCEMWGDLYFSLGTSTIKSVLFSSRHDHHVHSRAAMRRQQNAMQCGMTCHMTQVFNYDLISDGGGMMMSNCFFKVVMRKLKKISNLRQVFFLQKHKWFFFLPVHKHIQCSTWFRMAPQGPDSKCHQFHVPFYQVCIL